MLPYDVLALNGGSKTTEAKTPERELDILIHLNTSGQTRAQIDP